MKPILLYIITKDSWGGAQRYVYDLATHLYRDYRVVIGIGGKPAPQGLQERIGAFNTSYGSDIEVSNITNLIRPISPIQDLQALHEIRKLYKKLKPQIVHLNSSKAGVLGSIAGIQTNIPIVYTVHGWVFKEPLSRVRTLFYLYSEKLTKHFKDTFIILSAEEKAIGQTTLCIPEKKMEIVPLGIEETDTYLTRSDARKKLHISESDTSVHIGVIANFFATKGLNTLVEALHLLSDMKISKPHHVHVIGDGPTRDALESKIKKYGLETAVTLHGFISEAEKFIRAFDLFIIPSLKEGLPYALLESVKLRIPVIATHVGGIPSFAQLSGGDIQLVPPNNPHNQASAIIKALSHITQTSPQPTTNFSLPPIFFLKNMVEKTNAVYSRLITKE